MEYQNIVVMDVETGGLNCNRNPITQIGLLALNGETYEEIAKYETFVKPYAGLEILDKALGASRVSMTDVLRGVDIKDAVKAVAEILKRLCIKKRKTGNNLPILVGHNIAFDIGFLTKAFSFFQMDFMEFFYPIPFDTLSMMRRSEVGVKLDKGIKYNLTACCERNGIKPFAAHGAMDDVYATASLFKVLDNNLRGNGIGKNNTGENGAKNKARKFFEFYD